MNKFYFNYEKHFNISDGYPEQKLEVSSAKPDSNIQSTTGSVKTTTKKTPGILTGVVGFLKNMVSMNSLQEMDEQKREMVKMQNQTLDSLKGLTGPLNDPRFGQIESVDEGVKLLHKYFRDQIGSNIEKDKKSVRGLLASLGARFLQQTDEAVEVSKDYTDNDTVYKYLTAAQRLANVAESYAQKAAHSN